MPFGIVKYWVGYLAEYVALYARHPGKENLQHCMMEFFTGFPQTNVLKVSNAL